MVLRICFSQTVLHSSLLGWLVGYSYFPCLDCPAAIATAYALPNNDAV